MTNVPGDTATQTPPGSPSKLRFRDSMPKPLMAVFALVAVGALVLALVLVLKPPSSPPEPLGRRLLPPVGTLAHDVGRIVPAPIPSPAPAPAAVCSPLDRLRIEAGTAGQVRLAAAVRALCALGHGGVPPELQQAVLGLDGVTIRFAAFDRTAEEATADLANGILYVNVRFARANTPTILVAPVLVHEGWHLAHRGLAVTAEQEYLARVAELDSCRQLIDRDKWIRDCLDAEQVVALGETRAVDLLVAAGYAR
jgi:hypothetical protein